MSCLPPHYLRKLPKHARAPHWLLTFTEGSECPDAWADIINESGVERVIVPCEHNRDAFARGGVVAPISVVPGGTDPFEFPLLQRERKEGAPYTFLALADRGSRKGWDEVYDAFYKAFGGKTTGQQDVRLIIKCRPEGNAQLEMIAKATDLDKRLCIQIEDVDDMREVYAQADCFVIPSRSEGWGMPHREAAMMGIPVITQAYSGMDDEYVYTWASVVRNGHMERIPSETKNHIKGEWRVCDRDELADVMRQHYENPDVFARAGIVAARCLRANQTWDHSASALLQLLQQEGVLERRMEYA